MRGQSDPEEPIGGKSETAMNTTVISEAKTGSGIEANYSGLLDEKKSFLCRLLFDRYISRVLIAQEYIDELSELSGKGVIVFALKNKSQLNCLIMRDVLGRTFQWKFFCDRINMMLWQPFSRNLSIVFNRMKRWILRRGVPGPGAALQEVLKNDWRSVIYLRGSEFLSLRPEKDPILQLIEAVKELDRPVYIVPVLVSYGRRRERTHKNFLEILFGEKENPGSLRRAINFFRHSKKGVILCSRPVLLNDFVEKYKGKLPETISYNIRRELIERIDTEKRAIFGPVLKSQDELIETALRDTFLVKLMEDTAASEKKDYRAVSKIARKYLKEIASDYNEIYVEIWKKALYWLWNNIYDGIVVDHHGMLKIKDISKKMPFVIIPCHRSHTDYLLLSYIFDDYKIPLPFIAAGANLSFWPVGPLFRKSGAFFLRRSFQGLDLYQAVFSKYMKVLLKEGLPIEFFIEGGRSRTGKMIMPKYGLLSMVIQAFKEGISRDLALIPVFIGYDRVMEEKSYLRELGGVPKKPESAVDLLKTGSILRKRFGSVYVNVGEPIFLGPYLDSLEKRYEDMPIDERRSLYRKIGYEVVGEINKVSVVTPFALVACGLLCHYRRGVTYNELMDILKAFYDYLVYSDVRFTSTFANREKAIEDALAIYESSNLVSKMGIEEEDRDDEIEEIVYSVDDEKRLNIEYYKNNILNFFISFSFVASSILSNREDAVPLYRILEDFQFFKRLFRHEFIFDDKRDDVEEVNKVLNYMHETGMIIHEPSRESSIEVKGKGRTNLRPFAGLIHNYIESYWVVVRGCSYLKKGSKPERDFSKKIQLLGTRMYRKGEITRSEALSTQNYQSAIRSLVDYGILSVETVKDKKERESKSYLLTEDKLKIELLRQKLFQFL